MVLIILTAYSAQQLNSFCLQLVAIFNDAHKALRVASLLNDASSFFYHCSTDKARFIIRTGSSAR
jgi:hypothetical protein